MAIQLVKYEITGISPLLMNNPASMVAGGDKSKLAKKTIPTPEEEAKGKVYADANGELYAPAEWFRGALLGGCKGKRIGKLGAAGQVAAGVFCSEDKCPLFRPKGRKPITGYDEIDSRRVVVQTSGVIRSRPKISPWACIVVFEIDSDFVTPEQVEELLNLGGRIAGAGDYSPRCKGPFGRFTAKLVA